MRRHILMLPFLAALLSAGHGIQAATPHPTILYTVDGAVVSGSSPGGQVILFGLSRKPLGVAAFTARRCMIQTADATGSATFSFGEPPPRSSIYAAVDYESGAYAIATPNTYPLRLTAFPIGALRKHGDTFTELGLDRVGLQILCVRPKKGAWQVFLTDCSRNDRDGVCDGKIVLDSTVLQPVLLTKEEVKDFKEHDVVIIIDPLQMDIMASEVGK